jgi:hypothetical protein
MPSAPSGAGTPGPPSTGTLLHTGWPPTGCIHPSPSASQAQTRPTTHQTWRAWAGRGRATALRDLHKLRQGTYRQLRPADRVHGHNALAHDFHKGLEGQVAQRLDDQRGVKGGPAPSHNTPPPGGPYPHRAPRQRRYTRACIQTRVSHVRRCTPNHTDTIISMQPQTPHVGVPTHAPSTRPPHAHARTQLPMYTHAPSVRGRGWHHHGRGVHHWGGASCGGRRHPARGSFALRLINQLLRRRRGGGDAGGGGGSNSGGKTRQEGAQARWGCMHTFRARFGMRWLRDKGFRVTGLVCNTNRAHPHTYTSRGHKPSPQAAIRTGGWCDGSQGAGGEAWGGMRGGGVRTSPYYIHPQHPT